MEIMASGYIRQRDWNVNKDMSLLKNISCPAKRIIFNLLSMLDAILVLKRTSITEFLFS